ncbi:MAG: sigma-B regulation protein RsbU (phosphoserine phosphatase) [Cryomorphaceae bacterium]|jgi:sigma-B regulation protein RsbU (phosphoserine phosphatase)
MTDVFDQQTLELTLRASNEGIWDWDVDSGEIFYSDRIKEFLGYENTTPPNLMTHPERIVHEDSIDYFQDILSLTLLDSDAEHLGIDCKIRRPDGKSRWIRIRGIVIRNTGEAVRVAGSMIDISKRKFAEEMVAEERNMLRLIIDNIPLQVYFKDTNSCYKLVNQRQVDWLGKAKFNEVIGKSGEFFFSPESWHASRNEELQIMQTGTPVIDVIQREQWPNKPDTYVQKVKHPWYDSSGKLLGTYGISCDVTSLIQAKKKLENLALNLQQQHKNYEEELMLATEIQRAILPENSPDWDKTITEWKERVSIKTLYSPASELAGDFYDVISISEYKIGFLIIDVMGHGVRSAIIVSLIRGLMEQAEHLASEPSLYLEEINDGLTSILQKASITLFASACFTLVDFESDKITIASAGHDFPIIEFDTNATTSNKDFNLKGPALGILAGAKYPETIYPLTDIKSMLMFTDGIYEASNSDDQEWGIENLHQEFNNAHANHSSSTVHHIYGRAKRWMGQAQFQDDVCLINLEIV